MGNELVERLQEAIHAVAAIDVDALTDGELDELTIGIQRARHCLAAASARPMARWDARGVWLSDGSRSAAARLSRDVSCSVPTARRDLGRARALAVMPVTAAAVGEGRLSMDDVDLLAGADSAARHDNFARDEAMLVEHCATLRYSQAVTMLAYWKLRVDAAGCEADATDTADRGHLHASATLDDTVRLDGRLDPVGGAVFLTELSRLEREQYLADENSGVVRTPAQRRAAALVEMAARSASTPADAQRARPLITVLIGEQRFDELCELATGTVLTPTHVMPHLGVADLETMVFGDDLTVLGVSSRRTFVGRIRRAIQVRDRHCQHPSGCDVPAPDCDVDHITPDVQGGITSQFNGRLECRPHNRDSAKHDHGTAPRPERDVSSLDLARARLRWQIRHDPSDDDPDPDDDDFDPDEYLPRVRDRLRREFLAEHPAPGAA